MAADSDGVEFAREMLLRSRSQTKDRRTIKLFILFFLGNRISCQASGPGRRQTRRQRIGKTIKN